MKVNHQLLYSIGIIESFVSVSLSLTDVSILKVYASRGFMDLS